VTYLKDKLTRGEDAFGAGDLLSARKLLLECAEDPAATPAEQAQALNDLGVIAAQQQQPQESEAFLLEALARVRDYAPALENMANWCTLHGDAVQATHWCRRAAEATPDDPDAWRRLADVLQQRRRLAEASEALAHAHRGEGAASGAAATSAPVTCSPVTCSPVTSSPEVADRKFRPAGVRPERVLIVTDWFYPSVGGTERLAEAVGVALQHEGMSVEVAARPMAARTSNEHRGMTIHEINGDSLPALTALVRDRGYDAIVALSNTMVWPVLATLHLPQPRPRIVVVPCVNALDAARLQGNPETMHSYARMVAGADVLGYSSRSGYDVRLWDELGLSGVYLPNAIEWVPAGSPPTAGISKDAPLLLMVANFWPEKNHVGLLRSLRNHPGDFRLALIGGPSPEHPRLADAVANLASQDPRVHILGPQSSEAVAAAMDDAAVLLLPSLAEATPLVLLEAMSRRLPWIAAPTCGAAHDHAGGMILPLELFDSGIDFLLANPEAAHTLGVAGADHWRTCYTWDVIGPRYARVVRGQPLSDLQAPSRALADTDAVRAQFYDGRVGTAEVSLAAAA
jgi:glycosyltransferase involved in cell wall biosynthesis